jgi:succinate dehydrogenase/fumarate reductase flavoprotein subunit
MQGEGVGAVKTREAAALAATSRWAYASALMRAESRGMQRRIDMPERDPQYVCAFEVTGLDCPQVKRAEIVDTMAA